MSGRLLKITRILLSLLFAAVITASAMGVTSFLPGFADWLSSVQIFPAVMSFSVVIFVVWLLVTLIFGRIYCSTVCPLGTLQDLFARLPRLTAKGARKHHYSWRRPVTRVQYVLLVAVMVAMMAGVSLVASLFDPFTVYEGIVRQTVVPAAKEAGLLLEWHSMTTGDRVLAGTVTGCLVNTVILALVAVSAAMSGRTLCNSICPVGTTLGFVSRYAIMQIDIDTDKCVHCGACERVCKASCIDLRDCVVDGARCVDCFDCLTVCPNDAIHYTGRRHRLSDVLMQRIGQQRRNTESAATTAMNLNDNETIS